MSIIDQVYIAEYYLTAVEYYDISGLEDEEVEQIDQFLDRYPNCTFEYTSDEQFTRDVISGLAANCVRVNVRSWADE